MSISGKQLLQTINTGIMFASAFLLTVTSMSVPTAVMAGQETTTIFLVRHAEKTKADSDPELSEAGQLRARELADVLRDSGIEQIYSTDYIRTRDTAAPLADRLDLEVRFYDPNDLAGFAGLLKQQGQRQLVVGHSNTTPELVALLGGDPGTEIDESCEYDRLYVVTINEDGTVASLLLRYGAAFRID